MGNSMKKFCQRIKKGRLSCQHCMATGKGQVCDGVVRVVDVCSGQRIDTYMCPPCRELRWPLTKIIMDLATVRAQRKNFTLIVDVKDTDDTDTLIEKGLRGYDHCILICMDELTYCQFALAWLAQLNPVYSKPPFSVDIAGLQDKFSHHSSELTRTMDKLNKAKHTINAEPERISEMENAQVDVMVGLTGVFVSAALLDVALEAVKPQAFFMDAIHSCEP